MADELFKSEAAEGASPFELIREQTVDITDAA